MRVTLMAETNNLQVMIHDFHVAFGHPSFPFAWVVKGVKDWSIIGNEVNAENLGSDKIAKLRLKLLNEEVQEGFDAAKQFYSNDEGSTREAFIEIVDAVGDVLVLTLGTGCVYNLVLDCPSFDVCDEAQALLNGRELNVGLVFQLLFDELENLQHYLKVSTSAPKKSILQAAAVSRTLQNMVNLCFAHASAYGYNLVEVMREIHRSNMSKLGDNGRPIYREDGKIQKGPNYFKPDLASVLDKNDAVFPV